MPDFERLSVAGRDGMGAYEELKIDTVMYPAEIVLKTAYWFTDRCYLQMRFDEGRRHIIVTFRSKEELLSVSDQIPGDFVNALIDQSVRAMVQRETQEIQSVIVKRAFAEGLSDSDLALIKELG